MPVGSNFYGHVSPGKLPVFDSTDVGGGEVPITGTAEGVGHMVYDRKASYPTETRLTIKMRMTVTQGSNVMHMEIGTKQHIHCVIVKE